VKARDRAIEVWGDWAELRGVTRVGTLHATPVRGKEIFAFECDSVWVGHPQRANLDPNLALHRVVNTVRMIRAVFEYFWIRPLIAGGVC
jgi:serine/threonine-protein kinase HipA